MCVISIGIFGTWQARNHTVTKRCIDEYSRNINQRTVMVEHQCAHDIAELVLKDWADLFWRKQLEENAKHILDNQILFIFMFPRKHVNSQGSFSVAWVEHNHIVDTTLRNESQYELD